MPTLAHATEYVRDALGNDIGIMAEERGTDEMTNGPKDWNRGPIEAPSRPHRRRATGEISGEQLRVSSFSSREENVAALLNIPGLRYQTTTISCFCFPLDAPEDLSPEPMLTRERTSMDNYVFISTKQRRTGVVRVSIVLGLRSVEIESSGS
ncbi:hypothetical protein K0M31_004444 [Melipona bicolor]|uniref:Uncharacterized protein n=1 Tax=Melipona bicolor TaxID=60889 RepID=A0AA40FWX1_9HYME|nr:hypothetical protein K0M31_004444 [Melipona bicolor]